jgi:hypothetical protein
VSAPHGQHQLRAALQAFVGPTSRKEREKWGIPFSVVRTAVPGLGFDLVYNASVVGAAVFGGAVQISAGAEDHSTVREIPVGAVE